MHLHPETACCGGQPFVFGPAVRRSGQPQAAGHFPAGFKPGLGRQRFIQIDRVFQHLGDAGRRPQLPDQPRRMPGGPRGQLALFQQYHISFVIPRQMIGGRTADNAPPDDDDLGMGRQGHGGLSVAGVIMGGGNIDLVDILFCISRVIGPRRFEMYFRHHGPHRLAQ